VLQIPDKLLGDERRLERVFLRLRPQIRERLSGRRLVRQGGDEVGDVYTHDVPPHKRRSASGRGQGEGAGEAKREREREGGQDEQSTPASESSIFLDDSYTVISPESIPCSTTARPSHQFLDQNGWEKKARRERERERGKRQEEVGGKAVRTHCKFGWESQGGREAWWHRRGDRRSFGSRGGWPSFERREGERRRGERDGCLGVRRRKARERRRGSGKRWRLKGKVFVYIRSYMLRRWVHNCKGIWNQVPRTRERERKDKGRSSKLSAYLGEKRVREKVRWTTIVTGRNICNDKSNNSYKERKRKASVRGRGYETTANLPGAAKGSAMAKSGWEVGGVTLRGVVVIFFEGVLYVERERGCWTRREDDQKGQDDKS
jgi:hypothetical protein